MHCINCPAEFEVIDNSKPSMVFLFLFGFFSGSFAVA